MEWINNPEYWVLIAFAIFCGILVLMGVPSTIGKALDARAVQIKRELDEAKRLREEAQALLLDYQRKQREADAEARAIIDAARREAEALAADTRRSLAEMVERRTRSAEEKIARAEAQAVSEVKSAAVDKALAAAERILVTRAGGPLGTTLVEDGIRSVDNTLGRPS